jgi:outer membrane protein assembly factor BamB
MQSEKPIPTLYSIITLCALILCAGCETTAVSRAAETPGFAAATYHGDSGLKGFVVSDIPNKPEQLWQFKANARIMATPVVGGGRIYFASDPATVHALDLKGKELWTRQLKVKQADTPERDDAVLAPALYLNEQVIVGAISGALYSLNAQTGEIRWKYDAGEGIQGTPNYLQKDGLISIIIIAQPSASLHSIDPATGEPSWKTDGTTRCDGSPSVDTDHIVFGSCAASLHVRSAQDGSELGLIPLGTGGEIAGGVALDGDLAFSGSRRGELVCFDLSRMEIAWTNNSVKGEFFTTPALADDRVVFAGGGNVYCADRKTGSTLWSFETQTTGVESPFIADNSVVATAGGNLYLLDLNDGNLIWSADISDSLSAPAVADGMIIVGTDDGRVIAFGKKTP